jgi:Uncharacterised protein conserved in bacteria (DUF2313)
VSIATTRALTDLALTWLAMLPPVLQEDPWVQAVLGAVAREVERLQGQTDLLAEGMVPTTANEYTLPLWEAVTGLPIDPPDRTVEERRTSVLASLLRSDGSGTEWERAMADASRNSYRYTEFDSGDPAVPWYSLLINTGLPVGVTAAGMRQFIRQITPANLHIDTIGGQTYLQLRTAKTTYTVARDDYVDYDNMRFGVA